MMIHSHGCPRMTFQICLGCGAKVCGCHGTARGQCPVCYSGLLSGYWKSQRCRYKGCARPATVAVPRVKYACREHARERAGYAPDISKHEPDCLPGARMASYTATLAAREPAAFPAGALP